MAFPLALDRTAVAVPAEPGTDIVVKGSVYSTHDGTVIDGVTTSWPDTAPGGASTDAHGLVDTGPGTGLRMVSRDIAKHEAHFLVTGENAPRCQALGINGPCMILRNKQMAQGRLLTTSEWVSTLRGQMSVDWAAPSPLAPTPASEPYLEMAGWSFVGFIITLVAVVLYRKRANSPKSQLITLGNRVLNKVKSSSSIVAAPLAPALSEALSAIKAGKIDPLSPQGKQVVEVFRQVDYRLDAIEKAAKTEAEKSLTAALLLDVQNALSAADEAHHVLG